MVATPKEALEEQLLHIHGSYISLIDKFREVEELGAFVELAQEQLDSSSMKKEERVHLLLSTFGREFSAILYEINSSLTRYREVSTRAIELLDSSVNEPSVKVQFRVEGVLDATH